MSRNLLTATGVLAMLATCNPRPATAQAAAMRPARSRSFSVALISSMTLRNSLRTNGRKEPYARTVYNTTLPGVRYWSVGLAPALRTSRPRGIWTLELPVTYETAHTYHAVRSLAPLATYTSPWPDSVFSAATLRADYVAGAIGGRYARKVSTRLRPFVGAQVGGRWPVRVRANDFSQNPPLGWYYQGQFLGRNGSTAALGHTTAAVLAGVELGAPARPTLTLGLRAEAGRQFALFDEVQPVWRAVAVVVAFAPCHWRL